MGTDRDARKRRAMRGQDDAEEYSGSEEEDRLAGLWQHDAGDDSDNDADLSEEAKRQLQHAAVPRQGNVRIKMSACLCRESHSHCKMVYMMHASCQAMPCMPPHSVYPRQGGVSWQQRSAITLSCLSPEGNLALELAVQALQ